MKNPEYEKSSRETDDGYSEKQIDLNMEKGVSKGNRGKKFYLLFEKKRKK